MAQAASSSCHRVLTVRGWFRLGSAAFSAALLALLAVVSVGQEPPPADAPKSKALKLDVNILGGKVDQGKHLKLTASFTVDPQTRRGNLIVAADIDKGWHIYSTTQVPGGPQKSQFKLVDSPSYKLQGEFRPDRLPKVEPPDVFKVPSEVHEGKVNWTAPIELAEGVDAKTLTIDLTYSGQVCADGGVCIPLFGEKIAAKFAGFITKEAKVGEYRPTEEQGQVVFKGSIEPAGVAPGGKLKLSITAEPNPGWHIYAYADKDPNEVSKPTLIALSLLPGWKRSPVTASNPPQEKPSVLDGLPPSRFYEKPVTWTIELTAPADSPSGEVVINGALGYQTCEEYTCLYPQGAQFRASVPVGGQVASGSIPLEFTHLEAAPGDPKVKAYDYVAGLAEAAPVNTPVEPVNLSALAPMIGFGLLGGLILNLMPCVLPVIGLKLLSLVQHSGHSRAKIFALNLWFVLGLLSVFAVLATAAAFANLGWGQQFTYTWFKVAMVVVVFAFALSFLGVWEIPIPGFAESSASSKLQHQEGIAGAYFKGVFTTLLATPCSGPFLGPVFAFTLAQPPLVTYILFGSVGLGMSLPYLLVGMFPSLVRWLPKPGGWMETVKQLMGFVLLGTVVYLFSTIHASYFIPTLALMMAVWLACWIIGQVPVYEDAGKQVRNWVVGIATAAAIGWCSFTFLGPVKELIAWQPYTEETLRKLQAEGKTVLIDFTADWCVTCQFNKALAINTPKVKKAIEDQGIVPLLADWTDRNDAIKSKLEELNSNAIPLLAIYPGNTPAEPIVLRDLVIESQVLAALEEASGSTPVGEKITKTAFPSN